MFDFDKLPKITLSDESVMKVLFGLLPIVLGVLAFLVVIALSEFEIISF